MPLYHYRCETCEKEARRICTPEQSQAAPVCCEHPMVREPHPVSTRCTEVLDNGAMVKKLERLTDAERLFRERAEITKKQQRGE